MILSSISNKDRTDDDDECILVDGSTSNIEG
jgi:hypothetical protein